MANVPSLKLSNGTKIPQIGLGTWQSKAGEVEKAVAYALKDAGYRHIDCAFAYGNEKEVGDGIKESGVPRKDIFITSKIWCTWHGRVEEQLKITLERLGTDYVDLLLVHWPVAMNPEGNHPFFPLLPNGKRDILYDWPLRKTWEQFEAVYEKGLAKAIGVSNFSQLKLEEEILPFAKIKPMVNQLEIHPYNPQHKLVEWLHSQDIVVEAYSPLGSTDAPLLKDDAIVEIAERNQVSPSSVLLGWSIAKGIVPLPKSVNPERILTNIQYAKLAPADVEKIDGLAAAGKQKRLIRPPWSGVKLGFDDWFQVDP
ncbi:hypothetical protein FRB90_003177 [Tulasnella sp. 427]|nr:hypothetical protein FRB90_003177 [Tulasnella sp. 427]